MLKIGVCYSGCQKNVPVFKRFFLQPLMPHFRHSEHYYGKRYIIPPRAKNVPYFFDISKECLPCHPKPVLIAASFNGRIDPSFLEPSQTIA